MSLVGSLPNSISLTEGSTKKIFLTFVGQFGSANYSYFFTNGTANSNDYSGGSGSGAFSIYSTSPTSKEIPISLRANADRVDEGVEKFSLVVNLSGALFENGSSQKVVSISIIDDLAIHGTSKKNIFSGTSGNDIYFGYGGADTINGRKGADVLNGGSQNDTLKGGGGKDVLNGGNGNDVLFGNSARDLLSGGRGQDILDGGFGNDKLTGGFGIDTFVFSKGKDVVVDFNAKIDEQIDLSDDRFISGYNDLKKNHITQKGDHVIIDDLHGNTMKFLDVSISELDAGNFIF